MRPDEPTVDSNDSVSSPWSLLPCERVHHRILSVLFRRLFSHPLTVRVDFLPLYFQIRGSSATISGVQLMPFSFGAAIVSVGTGVILAKVRRFLLFHRTYTDTLGTDQGVSPTHQWEFRILCSWFRSPRDSGRGVERVRPSLTLSHRYGAERDVLQCSTGDLPRYLRAGSRSSLPSPPRRSPSLHAHLRQYVFLNLRRPLADDDCSGHGNRDSVLHSIARRDNGHLHRRSDLRIRSQQEARVDCRICRTGRQRVRRERQRVVPDPPSQCKDRSITRLYS